MQPALPASTPQNVNTIFGEAAFLVSRTKMCVYVLVNLICPGCVRPSADLVEIVVYACFTGLRHP